LTDIRGDSEATFWSHVTGGLFSRQFAKVPSAEKYQHGNPTEEQLCRSGRKNRPALPTEVLCERLQVFVGFDIDRKETTGDG
jgi:hypothetical protein